jgi:transposase-like protein
MENKKEEFNYQSFEDDALLKLKQGFSLEGENGVLAPLLKHLLEAGLQGELSSHLSTCGATGNRRNGLSRKTVKTHFGNIDVSTPRDRECSFEPQLLPKRQTSFGDGLEYRIISLYASGMSYTDICDHLNKVCQLTISPASITAITDKILPEIEAW